MTEVQRVIGAPAAVFTLVGFVVGASIYTVPAELAAQSGAGVLVSFAVAALLALLGCVPTIQLACAFPVTGSGYVAIRELLSPAAGTVAAMAVLSGSVVAVALLAHGFTAYAAALWPPVGNYRLTSAALLVTVLALLNVLGTRTAVAGQVAMSLVFIAVLVTFGIAGVLHDAPQQQPGLAITNMGAIALGVVPAYFSFLGFTLIGELAGDMRSPEKTMPMALWVGFCIILAIYLLVTLALLLGAPQAHLAEAAAPVAAVAERVAGERFSLVVGVSALLAAATSINGVLMMVSRDVLLLSRDGVLPRLLGCTRGNGEIPWAAIVLVWLVSLGCISFDSSIQNYAITTVVGFVVFQALAALAADRLPSRAQAIYRIARYRFSPRTLHWTSTALVAVSVAMLVLGALSAPREVAAYAVFMSTLLAVLICRQMRRKPPGTETCPSSTSLRCPQ